MMSSPNKSKLNQGPNRLNLANTRSTILQVHKNSVHFSCNKNLNSNVRINMSINNSSNS